METSSCVNSFFFHILSLKMARNWCIVTYFILKWKKKKKGDRIFQVKNQNESTDTQTVHYMYTYSL